MLERIQLRKVKYTEKSIFEALHALEENGMYVR